MLRLAALCALLIPARPATALAQPPAPTTTPPAYETIYDAYNAPVFTTGALIFVASYGTSVVAAASSSRPELDRGNDRLYLPVVGPWLALNARGSCPASGTSCDSETTTKVLLVTDGLVQAAGMITMIDGLLAPSSHRVMMQSASTKVRVTPTVVGTEHRAPGLALSGAF
jgi:hypothetical protein